MTKAGAEGISAETVAPNAFLMKSRQWKLG